MGTAKLSGYRLRFHKKGQDGSAKADCQWTDDREHYVWGVVYAIRTAEKAALDKVEGFGVGYHGRLVSVVVGGKQVVAATYVAAPRAIVSGLRPYSWYLAHCVRGAREHRLPCEYAASIEAVEFERDPDTERDARETAIGSA